MFSFRNNSNSSLSGVAGEQPTLVTTIAAAADPSMTESLIDFLFNRDEIKTPINASPAPVGFNAST